MWSQSRVLTDEDAHARRAHDEGALALDVAAIGMLADQVPRTSPEKHWVEFLGQDTAFYMGPELLIRPLRAQVLYTRVRRVARPLIADPPDRLASIRQAWTRELTR